MQKILPKPDLSRLIEEWKAGATVYGPVRHRDIVAFEPLTGSDEGELCLAANTCYPPKSLFLPQSEPMLRAGMLGLEPVEALTAKRVVLGIRPCDARACQLLDHVFAGAEYADPYWSEKRRQTTLVALGCTDPCQTCFCTSVGSGPFDGRGVDVVLTDIGDGYVAETNSERGHALLETLTDASQNQIEAASKAKVRAREAVKEPFELDGIVDTLYSLFDDEVWYEVQQSCLGCGVCTFLCPTCHCFDIVDEAQRGERVRNWDTCMFRIYSQEASGHNPRPTNVERTRQRILHKYAYFIEWFDEVGCTGCGRCVRYCPAGIDIRQTIRRSQLRE
jgi:Pyruvate/2-oxoacid:ferredoxin oxidoreductase delta subunit